MSNRHLKRLELQQQLQKLHSHDVISSTAAAPAAAAVVDVDDDDDDDENDSASRSKEDFRHAAGIHKIAALEICQKPLKKGLFQLLAEASDGGGDDDDDDDDDDSENDDDGKNDTENHQGGGGPEAHENSDAVAAPTTTGTTTTKSAAAATTTTTKSAAAATTTAKSAATKTTKTTKPVVASCASASSPEASNNTGCTDVAADGPNAPETQSRKSAGPVADANGLADSKPAEGGGGGKAKRNKKARNRKKNKVAPSDTGTSEMPGDSTAESAVASLDVKVKKGASSSSARARVPQTTTAAAGRGGGGGSRNVIDYDDLERELCFIEGLGPSTEGASESGAGGGNASKASFPAGATPGRPFSGTSNAYGRQAMSSVLSFHAKYLNPEFELRQKFGAAVVREERQQQQPVLPRAAKRVASGATRSMLIPDAAWHFLVMQGRKIGGISMEPVQDRVGYFEYKFSPDYWRTQTEFMLLVNSLNQDTIIGLLQRVGDHIDTLLQVATIFRASEDRAHAGEFIERAIYILEKAFHSAFDLRSGNCRLDYRCKPNRALFIALFQHSYYLSERGCPRTALEVCKILLSLDPEFDPMAVLLVIDHYALRSQENEWLIKFFDVFQKAGRNLNQLPNFAYSMALANFRLKRFEQADRLLREALLSFPQVLKAINDKNAVIMDKKTAAVFDKVYADDPIVQLYAERCAWMFREPEVMRWLEQVSVDVVNSGTRPVTVRGTLPTPRNVLRHISQSHVTGVTIRAQHLPPDDQTMYDFDPFPPKDSFGDLTSELLTLHSNDMLSESTFANFLNSLHPGWTGQEDSPDNATMSMLEGMSNLLDAARNLMSTITGGNSNENNNNNQENNNNNNNSNSEHADASASAPAGADGQQRQAAPDAQQQQPANNSEDEATARNQFDQQPQL